MSDLAATVDRIFSNESAGSVRRAAEAGTWPTQLWDAVEAAGLPLALVDTGETHLGIDPADAFEIVKRAGAHAAPIPLPETMLTNWLLARAGLPPVAGPAALVVPPTMRVPWGRRAALVHAVSDGPGVAVSRLSADQVSIAEGFNIAREPRDVIAVRALPQTTATAKIRPLQLHAAAAALRTAQIAGAIDAATRMTVDYVKTRVQFGKPLAKFQAIQQSVAILAEQAALAAAATDMAAAAFARGIDVQAIAAAKTVAGEAASVAANIAHQMHGAIGFSEAYDLQHLTRRLWSWRDDDGSEAYWADHLGTHLAAQRAERLWAEITTL